MNTLQRLEIIRSILVRQTDAQQRDYATCLWGWCRQDARLIEDGLPRAPASYGSIPPAWSVISRYLSLSADTVSSLFGDGPVLQKLDVIDKRIAAKKAAAARRKTMRKLKLAALIGRPEPKETAEREFVDA